MYGTIARYRTKPGTEQKILQIEADLRAADPPGFLFECILRTDAHPDECFEVVVFDSKEAYFALANSPEQDARYRRLLELLEGEPEWHDGEIIYTNPEPRR
jgi:heme-degrading monooxygenase HmoA